MGNYIGKPFLFLAVVFLAAADAGPNEIALPAFSMGQSFDAQAAKFTDILATALSKKSGYMVICQAELSTRVNQEILTNINVDDVITIAQLGVYSGAEYVCAGKIDKTKEGLTLSMKLLKVSDKSVLLNLSENAAGTIDNLEGWIPRIVAKICTVLPQLEGRTAEKTAADSAELISSNGILNVRSRPTGASIFLNNKLLGKTDFSGPVPASREYVLRLEKETYETYACSLAVIVDSVTDISAKLKSTNGILKVSSRPTGASIFLNGKLLGKTDFSGSVPNSREYVLRLEKETYETFSCNLVVTADSTSEISMALQHTLAFNDSMTKAGLEKRKKFRLVRRVVFGALAAGFGGAGYYFNTKVNDATAAYNGYKGNNITVHNDNWQKVKDNESTRNIMYYVAGASAAGLVISIPF